MNQLGLSVLIWNAKRIDITLCKERRKTHRHPVSVCTVLSRTALWVGEMSTDAAQCWTSSWAYIYWACTPEDSVKFNFKHISHKAKASLWASVNFQPELMYTIVLLGLQLGVRVKSEIISSKSQVFRFSSALRSGPKFSQVSQHNRFLLTKKVVWRKNSFFFHQKI